MRQVQGFQAQVLGVYEPPLLIYLKDGRARSSMGTGFPIMGTA